MKKSAEAEKTLNVFPRQIRSIPYKAGLLSDARGIRELRTEIDQGDVVLLSQAVEKNWILKVRTYLTEVGRKSLPNYKPIEKGSPNFHRLNRMDTRSYVPACFHQFSFFPWNQDVFDFFNVLRDMFHLRNLLNGLPKDKFLGVEPEEGCTTRLSFQFYPKAVGQMNKHADPVDFHQIVVPMLLMSKKGTDYRDGGGFVETYKGKRLFVEDQADIGDLVLFHASIPHGVALIDPQSSEDWLSFEGRWTLLFAVNKLAANTRIANAKNLAS